MNPSSERPRPSRLAFPRPRNAGERWHAKRDGEGVLVGVLDGAFIIATGIGLWFATANPFKG